MRSLSCTVTAYSGYKADERPTTLTFGEHTLQVREIIDRWYGVDHAYFRVTGDDDTVYVIRHDLETGTWEMILTDTFPPGEESG